MNATEARKLSAKGTEQSLAQSRAQEAIRLAAEKSAAKALRKEVQPFFVHCLLAISQACEEGYTQTKIALLTEDARKVAKLCEPRLNRKGYRTVQSSDSTHVGADNWLAQHYLLISWERL